MDAKFKLISANSVDLFEERLQRFIDSLDVDDIIVDISFTTAALSASTIEYSALVHYKPTQGWTD